MKCRKCSSRAVINMRQHKLALCKDHYIEWFLQQTERTIKKYAMFDRSASLLAAVSGGKDSLSLWDVLWRLGYATEGLYIDLGIGSGNYSSESRKFTESFARERGLNLHVVNLMEDYGASVIDLSKMSKRGDSRPCSQCGLVKRYLMNKIASDNGCTVLVTGHNLDDEAAVLLGNTLRWSRELLPRQAPVLEASGSFTRKAKPFCRFYERETAVYAFVQEIAYIYEECPYSKGSKAFYYKDVLNNLEDQMTGSKLAFYQNFLNAKNDGFFNTAVRPDTDAQKTCVRCGQPTTTDICAFCRLVESAAN